MHFFNPVHLMPLLEVVRAETTGEEAVTRAVDVGETLGKECIVVRDRPGFATSRLGVVLGLEAIRMLEERSQIQDLLNQRAGEYADFGYDETGPDYGFYRYLAFCIGNVLSEEDANWVIDPMISFEAPEAIKMVEKTLRGLYEEEPKKPRRRAAAGGD